MNSKLCKDLQIGDKVKMDDNSFKTIKDIQKGMFIQPSRLIDWKEGGWSNVLNSDTAEIL